MEGRYRSRVVGHGAVVLRDGALGVKVKVGWLRIAEHRIRGRVGLVLSFGVVTTVATL